MPGPKAQDQGNIGAEILLGRDSDPIQAGDGAWGVSGSESPAKGCPAECREDSETDSPAAPDGG